MTYLLDVNVLMAILWQDHEHNTRGRSWFKSIASFATCPVVQLGFARVPSHPVLGYTVAPEQCFNILRKFLADERHIFIPDDLSSDDRVFRTDLIAGAKQVTDHYLVALAKQHGCTVATLDGALGRKFPSDVLEIR